MRSFSFPLCLISLLLFLTVLGFYLLWSNSGIETCNNMKTHVNRNRKVKKENSAHMIIVLWVPLIPIPPPPRGGTILPTKASRVFVYHAASADLRCMPVEC